MGRGRGSWGQRQPAPVGQVDREPKPVGLSRLTALSALLSRGPRAGVLILALEVAHHSRLAERV